MKTTRGEHHPVTSSLGWTPVLRAALAALLLASCAYQAPAADLPYQILLLDPSGSPVAQVTVTVLYDAGQKSDVTDNSGRVSIPLPQNELGKTVKILTEVKDNTQVFTRTVGREVVTIQVGSKPAPTAAPSPTVQASPTLAPTASPLPAQPAAGGSPTPLLPVTSGGQPPTCDAEFTSVRVFRAPLPPSDLKGTIAAPKPCATGIIGEDPLPLSGTISDVPAGRYLWIFEYSTNKRYYAQCGDTDNAVCAELDGSGRWSATAWVGVKGCKEDMHLVLVSLDLADHQALVSRMRQWEAAGDFPGLAVNELPPSTREIASVEVESAGKICE